MAIIGTCLVGSTLATILSKNGLKVICFDAGQHPKFSIGESLIIETSEMFRALAELYDVPELHAFGSENQFPAKRSSLVPRAAGSLPRSASQRTL